MKLADATETPKPTDEFKLTKDQTKKFKAIETTDSNYLVMGKPGVGKSVLIRSLINNGTKPWSIAAPTGLAALNVDGRTLHSLFRLPVSAGVIERDYTNFPEDERTVHALQYGIKALIIDEISMVRADMFDYIDRLLRFVKGNDLPFGGIQVIAVGDFFQLPPVVIGPEKFQLKRAGYRSPFAFSADVFDSFKVLELTEVLRQVGDPTFIKLLDSARMGSVTPNDLRLLNERVVEQPDLAIQLTATNKLADLVNQQALGSLPGASSEHLAFKTGDWAANPCDERLSLKIGAHVIVKKNGADRPPKLLGEKFESKVVNGTLGIVTDMEPDRIEINNKHWIYRQQFERKVKMKEDGKWREVIVATFIQMPLALAWAVSMHKSQGQSFDQVIVDPSAVFAPGQLYVALSRCRSLNGLFLTRKVTAQQFMTDKAVLDFYQSLKKK